MRQIKFTCDLCGFETPLLNPNNCGTRGKAREMPPDWLAVKTPGHPTKHICPACVQSIHRARHI